MPEKTAAAWRKQVIEEHARLRAQVAEIHEFLEKDRPEPGRKGSHTWAVELSGHLVKLHSEFYRHFRFEEQGGMIEELTTSHPHASLTLDGIVDEHAEMLEEARRLTTDCLTYAEARSPEDPALRSRVAALIARFGSHEAKETDLILSLEHRDIGLGD